MPTRSFLISFSFMVVSFQNILGIRLLPLRHAYASVKLDIGGPYIHVYRDDSHLVALSV